MADEIAYEDQDYTSIACTVCRPRSGTVWIVINGGAGLTCKELSLTSIHPVDVEEMRQADRVQDRQLRVLRGNLGVGEQCELRADVQPPVPPYGDLFGALL